MLIKSSIFMFVGSVILGIFLNGMNVLAYKFNHIYFSAKTLIYIALFMASNMVLLEILMYYEHSKQFPKTMFIFFILLSCCLVVILRKQLFINDKDWLKRMISHHSTALTTSHRIKNKTKDKDVKKLASQIIDTQEKEIKQMKQLLKK